MPTLPPPPTHATTSPPSEAPFLVCSCCGEVDVDQTRIIEREQTHRVKGDPITFLAPVRVCECGEDIFDFDLDNATMIKAYDLYREKHHLVSRAEIADLRARYGLSQKSLAALLGMGELTIHRYENGNVPDAAQSNLLRAMQNPTFAKQMLEANGEDLSALTRGKLERKLNEILAAEGDERASQILEQATNARHELPIRRHAPVGANRPFSSARLMNMMEFFVDTIPNGLYKTKLNKLLFYGDFGHFRTHHMAISGARYVHLPHGPVPDHYGMFLGQLLDQGRLEIREEDGPNGVVIEKLVTPTRATAPNYGTRFSPEELATLRAVAERFRAISCVAISDLSHEEDAYTRTRNGEAISYEYAARLKVNLSA